MPSKSHRTLPKAVRTPKGRATGGHLKHFFTAEGIVLPTHFRLYVVVPNTVQAPLTLQSAVNPLLGEVMTMRHIIEVTQSITQPPGRVVAQAAHVVSKVRVHMERQYFKWCRDHGIYPPDSYLDAPAQPLTTIVLGARDSNEVNHVYELMKRSGIPAHEFEDTEQPDYGDPNLKVRTAICTEPISPDMTLGVTDYMPLWAPWEGGL